LSDALRHAPKWLKSSSETVWKIGMGAEIGFLVGGQE
jgi:hypothetical protein